MAKLELWGNYSIPKDNPYMEDKEMVPEIWAYGLRNPWRCSFDSERPSYFLCADVGQVQRLTNLFHYRVFRFSYKILTFWHLYRMHMKKLISSPREETTDGVFTKDLKVSSLRKLQGGILLQIPLIQSSQFWDTVTPILINWALQRFQVDTSIALKPIHAPMEGKITRMKKASTFL